MRRVVALMLFASLLATAVWVFATIGRPLDGVEGDVLFEADRIRSGFALYVDPNVGAFEYGEPPARYLVLYPPVWSFILSILPKGVVAGRILGGLAWFGAIGFLTWRARSKAVQAVAAFVAGLWILGLYGASARPDSLAVMFSALALERAARRQQFDLIVGLLFGVAAWIKPNVIGAAPGALLGVLLLRKNPLQGLLGIAGVSILIGGVLHVVSHGQWIHHLLASTGQPPNGELWLHQIADRGPFFLVPLGITLYAGIRAKERIATCALATSMAWMLLSLSKIGSATNYFMEPCLAMLVVLTHVELPKLRALPAIAIAELLWTGVSTLTGTWQAIPRAFERKAMLAEARSTCSGVILADEPGLELTLNNRIVMTPFQTTHLVRSGRFPLDTWVHDLESTKVDCLVMQDNLLERPLTTQSVAHDRFPAEIRSTLNKRFELSTTKAGLWLYRIRRNPPLS